MKRTNLTVMALCAMLLGAGAAQAGQNQQQNNTQLFPATGQTTVYAVGDDGYYKAGARSGTRTTATARSPIKTPG
jgi:hypothetical protein